MKKIILSVFLTLCSLFTLAQDSKANFSDQYKKVNQGKYNIEIDEVKELVHIMIAITKAGLENDDMVQQEGKYYQDVLQQFKPYAGESIIQTFDSLLQKSLINYIFLTGNAITYKFSGDTLLPDYTFNLPADEVAGIRISYNPITTYKKAIEEFALKSDFRKFYTSHNSVYKQIIADYEKNANLNRQWKWLEKNFYARVNSYEILCSPLINGLNYTGSFKSGDFELIQMVLPPITRNTKWTPQFTEAFNTRGMFTEIDHNYVNPPSDKYKKEINEALKDRSKWVDTTVFGTEYYPNPIKVFNEYMTFAAFVLYCEDVYKNDAETLNSVRTDVNGTMSKQRGFVKMAAFNEYLTTLRNKNKGKKIDELYPELLKWCAAQ